MWDGGEGAYDKMLKFADNQMKKILLYWVSVLCSRGTGKIPGVGLYESCVVGQNEETYLGPRLPSSVISS